MSLSELRDLIKKNPISNMISRYIPIENKGGTYLALCPFHADSNPSLNINDQKELFYCFACQTGGDHIAFVQKYKAVGYVDALKELSHLYGYEFEKFSEGHKVAPRVTLGKKLLTQVCRMYRECAKTSASPEFRSFVKERGLSPELLEQFQIGFSPKENLVTRFIQSFPDKGHRKDALEVALEIGLIKRGQKGPSPYYDTFRERVIFPIWDQVGQVQGITSRALKSYQKAKYMNSQASYLFDKKDLLYGLHLAKTSIRERDEVILCEGNMDVIALHRFGFDQSVAVMGTALGKNSLKLANSLSRNIYLAMDSDLAGQKAAIRMNQDFMREGVLPKMLNFSPYKDPDEFLVNEGPEKFQILLDEAPVYLDLMLQEKAQVQLTEDNLSPLELLPQVFEMVSPLGTGILATERLAQFAQKINLSSGPQELINSYKEYLESQESKTWKKDKNKKEAPSPQGKSKTQVSPIKTSFQKGTISKGERALIEELVQNPQCLESQELDELIDLLPHPEVQSFVYKLRDLMYEIEDSEYPLFIQDLVNKGNFSDFLKKAVNECLYKRGQIILSDEQKISRLLNELKIELQIEKLEVEKSVLRKRLQEDMGHETEKVLREKLDQIFKEINRLHTLKRDLN